MEELDAKIEKINYDLLGLESRKKEIEEKKFAKQQEIEKQEEEKKNILAKTDKMNKLQKIIYIVFALKNDLKQVELLNAKIEENRKEKRILDEPQRPFSTARDHSGMRRNTDDGLRYIQRGNVGGF